MTDDLVERLRIKAGMIHLGETIAWGSDVALMHEAVARITDLEAKLQRLGRELNLAKYGEPDFAWEIHKNAVAELEARLAAAEAGEDALAAGLRALWFHDAPHSALAAYEARRKG